MDRKQVGTDVHCDQPVMGTVAVDSTVEAVGFESLRMLGLQHTFRDYIVTTAAVVLATDRVFRRMNVTNPVMWRRPVSAGEVATIGKFASWYRTLGIGCGGTCF